MTPFNNCIALGVENMEATANAFVRHFGGEVTDRHFDWIEVTTGPYRFYFVEDGTRDIAFSVDCPRGEMEAALHRMADDGFVVDAEITERVGETFVRDPNGILINLNEVD